VLEIFLNEDPSSEVIYRSSTTRDVNYPCPGGYFENLPLPTCTIDKTQMMQLIVLSPEVGERQQAIFDTLKPDLSVSADS
jgi:hypothetical protein